MAANGMSVLLVDDDPDICQSITALLDDHGFTVECAQDGQEAVGLLESGLQPAVVLLDLMMPRMSGWQLWDWMQEHPQHRHTPVVVLTATGLSTGSLGDLLVLQKPVGATQLVSGLLHAAAHPR